MLLTCTNGKDLTQSCRKDRSLTENSKSKVIKQKRLHVFHEKKEEILLSPMSKAPTPTEKSKSNMTTQKRHQKLRLHNDQLG